MRSRNRKIKSFRPGDNSLFTWHLTLHSLLCIVFINKLRSLSYTHMYKNAIGNWMKLYDSSFSVGLVNRERGFVNEKWLFSGDCIIANESGGYSFYDFWNQESQMNKNTLVEFKRRYQYSPLKYFYKELGI